MKKRKILYLFPLAALVLSGCTFQEGWEITRNWTNEKVFTPVVDFFKGLLGIEDKKEEKKDDEKPTPDPQGGGEGEGEGGGEHEGPQTEHQGTEQDPYSAEDAVLVANSLEADGVTSASYYIKGKVEYFEEAFDATYGNYSFMMEGGFIAWRLKYGPTYQKFNDGDIAVGDEVTVYAQIQNFKGEKPETKGGYVVKVEKQEIDAQVTDLAITGTPKTAYLAGETYSNEGLRAVATFDNGEQQDVTLAATWTYSKETAEVGDTTLNITASYKNVSNSINVSVTVQDSSNPEHAGTEQDPYTGADAMIVGNKLNAGQVTESSYYIKGKVVSFEESFNPDYGNFSFKIEGGFIGWRLKYGENFTPFTSASDLEVGDEVTMYAQIQNYQGKPETKGGYIVEIDKPVVAPTSIELSESSLTLEVGQMAQLTATVLPANATNKNVEWTVAQTAGAISCENGLITALTEGTATVTATALGDPTVTASCEVTVNAATKTLTSVVMSGTPKTEYYDGDAYSREGLTLTAVYSDQSQEDVTAVATWEISKETAEIGDTSITITASYNDLSDSMNVAVTVTELNQFAEAYEAALAISSGETAEFTFKGVIVAKRQNNEWFIQHDGMGIEYYANNANFAVGKLVKVTSTLQNYKGLPETKTIKSSEVLGDGTMPTPVELASGADVAAAKLNVLANVTGTAKADWSSYSAGSNNTLTLVGSDGEDIAVYFKSGLFSDKEAALKAVKEGDTVTFTNVVTSKFNNPQILFAAGSDLTVTPAPVKEIASITSVTGPTEVALNGTVSTNDVTVVVEYTDGSSGNATVTAVTVDTTSAGEKTADVTIEGWNETLHFTITVSNDGPVTPTYYDATMAKGTDAYDDGTVNGKPCIKIGTSKKGGTMTITVPAGAVELKVYACAWNGVSNLSLGITSDKTGVTTSPTALALTADSGASNNSPFTIADESVHLFTITLTGVTEQTVLTFTTSLAKRAIVWGAQYAL